VEEVKLDIASKREIGESDKSSIFHHILQSNLPESEKDPGRLQREAFALLAAGTITTASTMSIITFYILANPDIEKRLRDELDIFRDGLTDKPVRWAELEKIPYLNGCIKEGLRFVFDIRVCWTAS
jgi:cytochrome P450